MSEQVFDLLDYYVLWQSEDCHIIQVAGSSSSRLLRSCGSFNVNFPELSKFMHTTMGLGGSGAGCTRLLLFIAHVAMSTTSTRRCEFNVIDVSAWDDVERQIELISNDQKNAFKKPILFRNAFVQWDEMSSWASSKANFVKRFGEYPFVVARDLEGQSFSGDKVNPLETNIADWVDSMSVSDSIGDNETIPRYAFTWLDDSRSADFNAQILAHYAVPDVVRWAALKLFFTVGERAAGIRLHNHVGPTWVALFAGSKRWYVWDPKSNPPLSQAKTHAQSAFSQFLTCEQKASEVVLLPSFWWHATFDLEWTIGLGGQSAFPAISKHEFAAVVGNLSAFELVKDKRILDSSLSEAAKKGHMELAELLISKGAGVTDGHWRGRPLDNLRLAATSGHLGAVAVLLEYGACPSPDLLRMFAVPGSGSGTGFSAGYNSGEERNTLLQKMSQQSFDAIREIMHAASNLERCFEPHHAQAKPVEKTTVLQIPVEYFVQNLASQSISVFWQGDNNQGQLHMADIPSGSQTRLNSFSGHRFLASPQGSSKPTVVWASPSKKNGVVPVVTVHGDATALRIVFNPREPQPAAVFKDWRNIPRKVGQIFNATEKGWQLQFDQDGTPVSAFPYSVPSATKSRNTFGLRGSAPGQRGDIVVTSYPKCGNTWTMQIVLLLLAGGNATRVTEPESQAPWIETWQNTRQSINEWEPPQKWSAPGSPRVRAFKTHTAAHLAPWIGGASRMGLPRGAKIIAVTRNPKDVALSYFHHGRDTKFIYEYSGNWSHFLNNIFLPGHIDYGNFWTWHSGWWNTKKALSAEQILWLNYEDMHEDLDSAVKHIADFIGVKMTPQMHTDVVHGASFQQMKKQRAITDTARLRRGFKPEDIKQDHFRKGSAGGWRDNMNEEDSKKIDVQHAQLCEKYGMHGVWDLSWSPRKAPFMKAPFMFACAAAAVCIAMTAWWMQNSKCSSNSSSLRVAQGKGKRVNKAGRRS